jgi:hypothetical protein
MRNQMIGIGIVVLVTSISAYASCEIGCWTIPNLYKPYTNSYPCANGNFQYQPLYFSRTYGNNVTFTAKPTNGGTLSNIQNAGGVGITWTHVGSVWIGHPTNFANNQDYGFALYASGANCTISVSAQ